MGFHSETHSSELRKLQQQAKPCFNKALDVVLEWQGSTFDLDPCSVFPSTPTHCIPSAILKAFHILSSDMKTRDGMWIMHIPYLFRQSSSKPSPRPQCKERDPGQNLEGMFIARSSQSRRLSPMYILLSLP